MTAARHAFISFLMLRRYAGEAACTCSLHAISAILQRGSLPDPTRPGGHPGEDETPTSFRVDVIALHEDRSCPASGASINAGTALGLPWRNRP
jgi:hypothetical protein